MKLLLVIATAVAVFTADCQETTDGIAGEGEAEGGRSIPGGPMNQAFPEQDQQLGEKPDFDKELKRIDPANEDHQLIERNISIADEYEDQAFTNVNKIGDMALLLGRSKYCKRMDGQCLHWRLPCNEGYLESPRGRPYCTSKRRRCCYPVTLTVGGSKCIFPFFFEGVEYNACAPGTSQPHPWCATSINDDKTWKTWCVCAVPTTTPVIATTTQAATTKLPGCRSPWFSIGSQCFYLHGPNEGYNELTWTSARKFCRDLVRGGDLAQPKDIHALAKYLFPIHHTYYWLGGSDLNTEGNWLWLDGTTVTGWRQGQPENADGKEDCLTIHPVYGANSLFAKDCDATRYKKLVCEQP